MSLWLFRVEGCAFVTFSLSSSAAVAIESLHGRVTLGMVSHLRNGIKGSYDAVDPPSLSRLKTRGLLYRKCGNYHLEYNTAVRAASSDPLIIHFFFSRVPFLVSNQSPTPLQVKHADVRSPGDRGHHKLFVGMLPKNMGDDQLRNVFELFGEIIEVP